MALAKRNYVSGETVITAKNLNEIQDSIIALEDTAGGGGETWEKLVDASLAEAVESVTYTLDNWAPGETGTESLWAEICESHDGTKYDPIPYSGNMALEAGKYYSQSGKTYLCNRDTGNPVYNALVDLVGLYVIETEV